MIKQDFLIRQLNQLIQALLSLLLKREKHIDEIDPEILDNGVRLLGIDKKQLLTLSADGLIDIFSEQPFYLEKTEAAAYLLLLDQQNNKINHNEVVIGLLTYIDENSNTYSIERNRILNGLINDEEKK